ncbi:30S ribosomal protein S8 [Candidatus Woesearchaeota archaeon]|nr:30S ribosomal protein S8 [Candidatus Woesearchaeota archaeon]
MLNDPLANVLSVILNGEKIGKSECMVKPISKPIKEVLRIMNENGYIGDFEEIEDGRGNHIKIKLIGMINKCGVIKPKYNSKKDNYEKFEKRYLPAKDIGIIFVSTTQGIMPHYDAKNKGTGGRLLAYCY